MPCLSNEQRAKILTLIEEGIPTHFIASKMGVSQSTVARTHQRFWKTGRVKNKPKPGRPRIFSAYTEWKTVRLLASKKCSTAVDQSKLRTEDNIQVSVKTVCQTLQRNGLRSRVKRKKSYLKKLHRICHLAFARKYQNWTVVVWSKVV